MNDMNRFNQFNLICSQKLVTIRTLLEISDSCLRINGFTDPWLYEKNAENSASLEQFRDRLDAIDRLSGNEKWLELFRGVFAGNIFDWGALVVSEILENDMNFGLENALKHIQPRPWLIDGMDAWLQRIEVSIQTHTTARFQTLN